MSNFTKIGPVEPSRYMGVDTWGQIRGNRYRGVDTWEYIHGNRYMGVDIRTDGKT